MKPVIAGLNLTFDLSQSSSISRELEPIISKKGAKKKGKKKETEISIKLIQKLSKLGIPEDSAASMAELRMDWDAIIAKNEKDFKIHCTEPKCQFRAPMIPKSLMQHCIKQHNWGRYKCPRVKNCQYVSNTKDSNHYSMNTI